MSESEPKVSSGVRRLGELQLTQAEIAAVVKVSQQAVSDWISMYKAPEYPNRKAMNEEWGISLDAWDDGDIVPRASREKWARQHRRKAGVRAAG